ncbi:MAG: hypothetical protein ACO1OB_01280 [Archangium sp.]
MPASDTLSRKAIVLLSVGALIGLVARVWFAFTDDGLLWPDEYYQSLEPAHRVVFGYGWQAWEFLEGARHWTLAGIVAGVMKLSGTNYLFGVELFFCLAGVATGFGVFTLARAQGASSMNAAVGATAFWLMGFAVYCSPRAMGETLSALPVTFAFAALLGKLTRWKAVIAGLLLTLAVGLRLQNGLFCLGALVVLWKQRSFFWWLLGTLSFGALLYGAVDWLTWGQPFHSAVVYVKFNLQHSGSFGRSHFFHYVVSLITSEGALVIPLTALAVRSWKQRREVLIASLVFLFVHSLIPHKELRFIFPLLPLLCAQAALGLDGAPKWSVPILLGLTVISLVTFKTFTFGRLGISNPPREISAIDYYGPENRLLRRASTLTDLCGLKLYGFENWRTGGYAYLHQRVPMYRSEPRESGEGHFNYAIAKRGTFVGTEIAAEADLVLLKLPVTGCTPDTTYDFHLE